MTVSIIMAPHSNQVTRDWPLRHFRSLAQLCVERLDAIVEFVGTRSQRASVNTVVRDLPSLRFINSCGLLRWDQTQARIRSAACVVSNNSGIGHLAATMGVPVVTIYSGTHSPMEWMPRGASVTTIVRSMPCSPCSIASQSECPYQMACLTQIGPGQVFKEVQRIILRSREGSSPAEPLGTTSKVAEESA
jgi:ADP-heptose:LPS heptosyltransferase